MALGRVLRLPPPGLTVAGRTDAGVHARGQVVHADVPAAAWAAVQDPLVRLAAVLPADVRVHAVGPAPDEFDARFSALWRRYSYRICDDPARADPLRRHETLWSFRRLDLAVMNEAARYLVGEHDFAAFCRRREGATTIRALRVLDWRRDAEGLAVATVTADAFCHNMVRALVGALLAVGEGRRPAVARPGARGGRPRPRGPRRPAARAVPRRSRLPSTRRAGRAGRRDPEGTGLTIRFPGQHPGLTIRVSRSASGPDDQGFPVSIRVLRLMLALPVSRLSANCSSCCRWADVDGDFRLVNSAHIKIR